MKKETVEAKVPANEEKGVKELNATVAVDFPDFEANPDAALQEAVAAYGAKAILSNAWANWKITLQSNIRNALKRGETQEVIQGRLGTAKMGVAVKGASVDPVQAYLAAFASATPDKQKAMLAELQARAAKK